MQTVKIEVEDGTIAAGDRVVIDARGKLVKADADVAHAFMLPATATFTRLVEVPIDALAPEASEAADAS